MSGSERQRPGASQGGRRPVQEAPGAADAVELAALYRHELALPSVHILGRTDGVIRPRESQALADQFEDPLVLTHSGGHVVPDDPAVVAGLVDFLERTSRR
jgi:predicted alpha/beta hydrolase family esterase